MQSNPKEKLVLLLASKTKRLPSPQEMRRQMSKTVERISKGPEGMKSDREINEATRRQMARIVERISKGPEGMKTDKMATVGNQPLHVRRTPPGEKARSSDSLP